MRRGQVCIPWYMHGNEKNWLFPYTMWVLRMKLGTSSSAKASPPAGPSCWPINATFLEKEEKRRKEAVEDHSWDRRITNSRSAQAAHGNLVSNIKTNREAYVYNISYLGS